MVFIFGVLFGLMRYKIAILICCLLLWSAVKAQPHRKAHKLYESALVSWSEYQKTAACRKMQKAIKKDPKSPDAYSQLGEWYFLQHKFPQALKVFTDGSAKCQNGKRQFAQPLARCLIYNYLPDSALKFITDYATIKDSSEWNRMRRQALFMKQSLKNIVQFTPSNMGIRINSKYPDIFPAMAADGQTLYFTRRYKYMNEDFYIARLDSCGEWLRADELEDPFNIPEHESAQFLTADGHYMFFSMGENRSDNGWAEGGYDLYMTYRMSTDSDWTLPQPFGATINTPSYEGMPSLSPDNRKIYFVSDRAGGYGGKDIWISKIEDGVWQVPVNAGPAINTAGDETTPYICNDNRTLYFTSNGHPGMGGTDIFMARKISDSTWANPVNLGYPINTACNEESELVIKNGKRMIFSSDRPGPAGNFDLYETELPYDLQPAPTRFLDGYVYDSLTKARLNFAMIYIKNAKTGDTIYKIPSNRGDGSYMLPLAINTTYAMYVAHPEQMEVLDTFTFDLSDTQTHLVHNVAMLPSDYKAPIKDSLIATIHFNINKVELTDSDRAVLGAAIFPWLLDKGIVLYVNGYTDNTGNPMLNEELSTKRANLVAQALTGMGVDDLSIIAKGWGEAKMIAPNDNEEDQKKNRRVEILLMR